MARGKTFPQVEIGPITTTPKVLWMMALILVVIVAVASILQFTKIGKAMRAVADNGDLAAASGIDVDRVAALEPDLIVTTIAPVDASGTLPTDHVGTGIADAPQQRELAKIAPVAEVRWGGDGDDVVRDVTDLTLSLGVTFPFNLVVGIPLYLAAALALAG